MKLFIRNIAWEAKSTDLQRWLTDVQGYQATDVRIVVSGEDGRSRGFGFATFPTREAGLEALKNLQGEDFMGRPLQVEEAVERVRGKKRNGGSRGRRLRRGDQADRPVSWDDIW